MSAGERKYVCTGCGAVCVQPVWSALELDEGEDKCPVCKRWRKFVAQGFEQAKKLVFGRKVA